MVAGRPVERQHRRPSGVLGPLEVVRQPLRVLLEPVRIQILDRPGGGEVERAAPLPEEALVHGVPREDVLERVLLLGHHAIQVHEIVLLELPEGAVDIQLGAHHLLEQALGEHPADHGCRLERALGLLVDPVDARLDDALDGRGHVIDLKPVGDRDTPLADRNLFGGQKRSQDFLDEQRVPLGFLEDGAERRRGELLGPEERQDEAARLGFLQRPQAELGVSTLRVPLDERNEVPGSMLLNRPLHADQDRARVGQPLDQPRYELQRQAVGPMEVVEHDDDGMPGGERTKVLDDGEEGPRLDLLGRQVSELQRAGIGDREEIEERHQHLVDPLGGQTVAGQLRDLLGHGLDSGGDSDARREALPEEIHDRGIARRGARL